MTQHSDGKWGCVLCEKSFSRKQDVKRHIMNLHQGNQEVVCPLCDKKCKNPQSLTAHNSIYHRNAYHYNVGHF